MKHIFTLAALILMILTHSACRTTKSSNRQQSRISEREWIDSRIRELESTSVSRSMVTTDSSGQFYQATIYPADSFQFSLRDGFKGKALKVEVRGSVKQLIRVNDLESMTHTRDSSEATKSTRKVESKQGAVSKSTKRKNNALLFLLVAGFVIMVGFWIKKFGKTILY